MATRKIAYPADSIPITITLASLASSATYVAGRESTAIVNTTNLDIDHLLSGKIRVGTTPTANTVIQVWVVPVLSFISGTPVYPDVLDGTDSAETWTAQEILFAAGALAASLPVNTATSDRDYYFAGISVATLFGGVLPSHYVIYVTHDTVANLHATGGNHALYYQRIQETVA